jgi:hypothetical protein
VFFSLLIPLRAARASHFHQHDGETAKSQLSTGMMNEYEGNTTQT